MRKPLRLVLCLVVSVLFLHSSLFAQSTQIKANPPALKAAILPVTTPDKNAKLSGDLQKTYNASNKPAFRALATGKPGPADVLNKDVQIAGNRVIINVTAKESDISTTKIELAKLGFRETGTFGRMISGSIPINAIPNLASLKTVRYAAPAYRPHRQAAALTEAWMKQNNWPVKPVPVISQGDTAQRSEIARQKYKVSGKGVKIGILSDSWNHLRTADAGIKHGELPGKGNPFGYTTPVQILEEYDSASGTDEGRMMGEIVHDVAPASDIAFHTAFNGEADFAQGIVDLAKAGCKVVVDDVAYFDEPYFQDGIISQAVDLVKGNGVAYFSAAGNQGFSSYESDFRPSDFEPVGAGSGTAHNFSAPGDPPVYFQPIYVPEHGLFETGFQWDDPSFSAGGKGAESDLDIYLFDSQGNVVAASYNDNIASGDPFEFLYYPNESGSSTLYIAIVKFAGKDPTRVKYINYGYGQFYATTPEIPGQLTGTLVGHAKAEGAIATGAAFWYQTPAYGVKPPVSEYYSSAGGVANYFDLGGNRITPFTRKKPEITAPDGGNIFYLDPAFGNSDIPQDTDTFPNFFGTSAAAPHAAAVAALMMEAEKLGRLTPDQIKGVLESHTYDMDDPLTDGFDKGFDIGSGYGLIKADGAVGEVKYPNLFIKNLKVKSLCSDNPAVDRKWTISNPNPFPVETGYYLAGGQQSGKLLISPGDTTFETPTLSYSFFYSIPNVLIIDWQDNFGFYRTDIAFSSKNKCGAPSYGKEETGSGTMEGTTTEEATALTTNNVEVYPNPSVGNFRVFVSMASSMATDMELYSIDGRKLQSKTIVQANGVINIDASSYKPGMYILKVRQGDFTKTFKLVRQ